VNKCYYCGCFVDDGGAKSSRMAYGKVVCDEHCQDAEDDERERFLCEREEASERFREEWGVYP
jgi:hypothetical protein